MVGGVRDVMTCAEFQIEIFMGYDFTGGRIFDFPIDFPLKTIPCEIYVWRSVRKQRCPSENYPPHGEILTLAEFFTVSLMYNFIVHVLFAIVFDAVNVYNCLLHLLLCPRP